MGGYTLAVVVHFACYLLEWGRILENLTVTILIGVKL